MTASSSGPSVIAALDQLAPGCGDRAVAMLHVPGSRAGAVDQLIADLEAEVRPPAVLVIDDFHLVDGDDFVARVRVALRAQPARVGSVSS